VDDIQIVVPVDQAARALNVTDVFLGYYGTKIADKSEILLVRPKDSVEEWPASIEFRRGRVKVLPAGQAIRILGYWISADLSWKQHVDSVVLKMLERLKLIERARVSPGVKCMLINSDVIGILAYSANLVHFDLRTVRRLRQAMKLALCGRGSAGDLSWEQFSREDSKGPQIADPLVVSTAGLVSALETILGGRDAVASLLTEVALWDMGFETAGGVNPLVATPRPKVQNAPAWQMFPSILSVVKDRSSRLGIKLVSNRLHVPFHRMAFMQAAVLMGVTSNVNRTYRIWKSGAGMPMEEVSDEVDAIEVKDVHPKFRSLAPLLNMWLKLIVADPTGAKFANFPKTSSYLNYMLRKVERIEDCATVATDGSFYVKARPGGGHERFSTAALVTDSGQSVGFRCYHTASAWPAEVMAVRAAAVLCSGNENNLIVTDCLGVKKLVERTTRRVWRNKGRRGTAYIDDIYAIAQLKSACASGGGDLDMVHINSHTGGQDSWSVLNEAADKLAERAHTGKAIVLRPHASRVCPTTFVESEVGGYTVVCNGIFMGTNTGQWVRGVLKSSLHRRSTTQVSKVFRSPKLWEGPSFAVVKLAHPAESEFRFLHQVAANALKTRVLIGRNSHAVEEDQICLLCNQGARETMSHLFLECPSTRTEMAILRRRVLDLIRDRPGRPPWPFIVDSAFSRQDWTMAKAMLAGGVPIEMRAYLRRVVGKKALRVAREASVLVTRCLLDVWRTRSKVVASQDIAYA